MVAVAAGFFAVVRGLDFGALLLVAVARAVAFFTFSVTNS